MKPFLEPYNIQVVALSKDTPSQVLQHQERDSLSFVQLLSDSKLRVIRRFGLEHQKALEFKTWRVLGVPLGFPVGFQSMAIPTTLLIDENGIIQWIDQADDYRVRGDEKRILSAIHSSFGSKPKEGGGVVS